MASHNHVVGEGRPGDPRTGEMWGRLAAVGVILLGVVGTFLCLGGWLTPHELTARRFTNGFEEVNGIHSGFRRNHAKGVGISGYFDSNGNGAKYSKAIVFRPGRVPVIGRFSLGGGDPYMADSPEAVRAMALEFNLADGEQWRTAMIMFPVFPFKDPEAFYEQMMATKPDPATHKPDPAKMAAFVARHPEFLKAIQIIKSHEPSSAFDNTTFYGLNAFLFTNANGKVTPVRWSFVPVQAFVPESAAPPPADNKNYLFDGVIASILTHPLEWHLILTIGQPGDATNDATVMWPEGREQVDAGTLTITSVEAEETSPARVINFDPLILPDGISPSDDPLLSARSAIYSQSFTRRTGETVEPSAITPAEIRKLAGR
ncbi:MAG TPA: catalase family peroxidase [Verrucomicrobiae bacterium]|nr:catalase family peroxidase [Verrucomicrobiae bacterium]